MYYEEFEKLIYSYGDMERNAFLYENAEYE